MLQPKSSIFRFLLAVFVAAGFGAVARAQVTFDGALTSGTPSFTVTGSVDAQNLPVLDPVINPLPINNGEHPYDVFSFQLDQAASVTFRMNGRTGGTNGSLIDPAILIYQGLIAPGSFSGFNSTTAPFYIGGNDDITAGSVRNSQVSLSLTAGTTYTLILTTWNSDQWTSSWGATESRFGDYTAALDVTGAIITPIPESSTYALFLGLATLGLVGWRRWKR
jgi:hypothetical protein